MFDSLFFFFFKQKTAYEMRISDWSSDVCSSDLIDTHCHLDFPDFDAERDELVARAHAAGVAQMVTISTRVRKLDGLLAIADRYPSVFCSVGTHPNNAAEELDIQADDLVRLAGSHEKIVPIGEAGLIYFFQTKTQADQPTGLRHP